MDPIFIPKRGLLKLADQCLLYKKTNGKRKKINLAVHQHSFLFYVFNRSIPPSTSPLVQTELSDDELKLAYHCVLMSYLAYEDRSEIIFPNDVSVVYEENESDITKIPFFVAVDKEVNAIIVSCRGSSCINDFVTDSMGNGINFDGGKIHQGIFNTASYVFLQCQNTILELNRTYNNETVHPAGDDEISQLSSQPRDENQNRPPVPKEEEYTRLNDDPDSSSDSAYTSESDFSENLLSENKEIKYKNKKEQENKETDKKDNDDDNDKTNNIKRTRKRRKHKIKHNDDKKDDKTNNTNENNNNDDVHNKKENDNDDGDKKDDKTNENNNNNDDVHNKKENDIDDDGDKNHDKKDENIHITNTSNNNGDDKNTEVLNKAENDDNENKVHFSNTNKNDDVANNNDNNNYSESEYEEESDEFNLDKDKKMKIIITGHSLGAAVAAVVAHFFRREFAKLDVTAVCFAPPPTFSFNLWEKSAIYIRSFMIEGDLVPFLSVQNIFKFSKILFPSDNSEALLKFLEKYLKKMSIDEVTETFMNEKLYPPGQSYLIRLPQTNPNKEKKKYKHLTKLEKKEIKEVNLIRLKNISLCQILNPDYFSNFVKNIQETNHKCKNYLKVIIRLRQQQIQEKDIEEIIKSKYLMKRDFSDDFDETEEDGVEKMA